MKSSTKTGLLVGGGALLAYLVWKHSQSSDLVTMTLQPGSQTVALRAGEQLIVVVPAGFSPAIQTSGNLSLSANSTAFMPVWLAPAGAQATIMSANYSSGQTATLNVTGADV